MVVHKGISIKRFLSHSASLLASTSAMSSDNIDESDITVCFFDFQDIAALPSVNIQPVVDLDFISTLF